ncbi:Uncharacterised protein [Achromobacter kerstersii]|nr:Uncharacterised protein [Achromobacter kerstersii]
MVSELMGVFAGSRTGVATVAAGSYLTGDGAGALVSRTPAEVLADIGAPPTTLNLTAGNGLTGGGTLAANRSFALGVPSTITTSTTNAVQASSHTHALVLPEAAESSAGILKLATLAQAQALLDDSASLTPKKLADAFKGGSLSLGVNGFRRDPGGLIIQWMTAPQTVNSSVTATFPFAFPNACLKVVVCESNSAEWFTNNLTVYGLFSPTKTGVGITGYRWNGTGFVAYTGAIANVIAIGY